ncbi:MAG: hypothetical protein FWF72_01920 [Paludibacter sp.]|nr:hypothetical protein [Paludibacter sp.]
MKNIVKTIIISLGIIISSTVNAANQNDSVHMAIAKMQEYFSTIDANNSYADNLNQVDMNNLPIGMKKTISNMAVTIAVNEAEFHDFYNTASVYVKIDIPEKGKIIFFGVKGVKFSTEGNIIGDAIVTLLGNIDIPINNNNVTLRLLGSFNENTGQSKDLTYVSVDCQGFKSLKITGEVELSQKLFRHVDKNGNIDNENVVASFQTEVHNWNDIIARLTFPNFVIKGLDGFIWNLDDVVFDFSDFRNVDNFNFPSEYRPYLSYLSGNENLWRGIYAKEIRITLPPQFSTNENKRVSFAAQNMIIDDNGVTGFFSANNILSYESGNANGWAFSVDQFGLKLLANNLESATFSGQVGLPVSQNQRLGYKGFISDDNEYSLLVENIDSLSFDFLAAKATLLPNSYLKFNVIDNKFKPEALLHGCLDMSVKMDNDEISKIKKLEFRSLKLQTEVPYLQVEYFGYEGEIKLLNFPVSLKNINITTAGNRAILGFEVEMTLSDDKFKGSTKLAIAGVMEEGKLHKWKYEKTQVDDINLQASIDDIFTLKGALHIKRNDPTYGNGFGGELSIAFNKAPIKGLSVSMAAMFGRTEFRYWYVDGSVTLPGTGIVMYPSVFLNGFRGSIAYRMTPSPNGSSGIKYVPDEKTSLILKSSLMFVAVKKNLLQCEAGFELAFNQNGGLKYAGIFGYGKFLGDIPMLNNLEKVIGDKYNLIIQKEKEFIGNNESLANELIRLKQFQPNEAAKRTYQPTIEPGSAGIIADVGLQINFEDWSVHGSMNMYLNVAKGVVTGVGAQNRAGWAVFHVDAQQWYLHVGTPTEPIGIRMGLGNIVNIQATAYFMVGTNIPAAPGIPQQVASILNSPAANINYMDNLNSINAGNGIAFGSQFSINTGDLTFLILYANFGMGMGFDLMLKDYGDAQCEGHNGPVGIDGWYANGQAYAYMHGELGVKVNLKFIKKKIAIIKGEIATLIRAKLPNPSYMQAFLAVRFSVLGGLIKGNYNFEMELGENCKILRPGASPVDMEMISDVSPADAESDVSVFAVPQVRFTMGIGKQFEVQNDEGNTEVYRIKLKNFALTSSGQAVSGNIKWNDDKDALSFYSDETLPPSQNVTLTAAVSFEEWRSGQWRTVYTSGVEATETKTVSFTTGTAPDYIPLTNVEYCYPVVNQRYFLKGEGDKGYIQLKTGQNYLFSTDYNYAVMYKNTQGQTLESSFTYNSGLKRIEYSLPQTALATNYALEVVAKNKNGVNIESRTETQSLINSEEAGSIEIEVKKAGQQTRTDIGNVLLDYTFATSRYSTFAEKMQNIEYYNALVHKLGSTLYSLGFDVRNMEAFDIADLVGNEYTQNMPLVRVQATLQEPYYTNSIKPLLYQTYPLPGNIYINNRNTSVLGVPPAKAITVNNEYLTDIESGVFTGFTTQRFPYVYNVFSIFKSDFNNIQSQILGQNLNNTNNSLYQQFVTSSFPMILQGNYRVNLQYLRPGNSQGASSEFNFYNYTGNN